MQLAKVGFVEPGIGLQSGQERLIGLLNQLCLDFLQHVGIVNSHPVDGYVGTGQVNITLSELILGHAAVP